MVFDMSDPGVKAMVDGWDDNTEYMAMVKVKTGAGPQRNVSEVTSFEPHDMEMMEEKMEDKMEGNSAPMGKTAKAKPEVSVKY
jgi:hypothetical protein